MENIWQGKNLDDPSSNQIFYSLKLPVGVGGVDIRRVSPLCHALCPVLNKPSTSDKTAAIAASTPRLLRWFLRAATASCIFSKLKGSRLVPGHYGRLKTTNQRQQNQLRPGLQKYYCLDFHTVVSDFLQCHWLTISILKISKDNGGIKELQDYFLKTVSILHFYSSLSNWRRCCFACMLNLSLIFF